MSDILSSRNVISGSRWTVGGHLVFGDLTVNMVENADYNQLTERVSLLMEVLANLPADDKKRTEYEQKLNEAQRQLAAFEQKVIQLAETISRIEINTERLKKARELFLKGKFNEANAFLDLEELKQDQTRLIQREAKAKTVLENARSARIELANQFLVKAELTAMQHQNNSWVDETAQLYEESLATFPQTDTYMQYSLFLWRYNERKRAIHLLKDALKGLEPDHQPKEEAWIKAGLAVLHDETNDINSAKQYYEESLLLWKKTDKGALPDTRMVRATLNMAIFYLKRDSFEPAEKHLKQCLRWIRHLPDQDTESNDVRINVYKNVGIDYERRCKFDTALHYYKKSLGIIEKNIRQYPIIFEPYKAEILLNIGRLQSIKGANKLGLKYLKAALGIFKKLYDKNPIAYKPMLITTLNDLGNWHNLSQRPDDAFDYFSEALPLSRQLATDDPSVYSADLALLLRNIGNIYQKRGAFGEALSRYTESLTIRLNLAQKDPGQFQPALAGILYDMIDLCLFHIDEKQALESLKKVLNIYTKLTNEGADAFWPDMADLLSKLGLYYSKKGDRKEAQSCLTESLALWERLFQKDPEQFGLQLARTNNTLGNVSMENKQYDQAGDYFKKATDTLEKMDAQSPDIYAVELGGMLNNLAKFNKEAKHDYTESERLYIRAIELIRQSDKKTPAPVNIEAVMVMVNMADLSLLIWEKTSDPNYKEKALAQCEEAQQLLQRSTGPDTLVSAYKQTLEEIKNKLL